MKTRMIGIDNAKYHITIVIKKLKIKKKLKELSHRE